MPPCYTIEISCYGNHKVPMKLYFCCNEFIYVRTIVDNIIFSQVNMIGFVTCHLFSSCQESGCANTNIVCFSYVL